jgi:hypothetical protein
MSNSDAPPKNPLPTPEVDVAAQTVASEPNPVVNDSIEPKSLEVRLGLVLYGGGSRAIYMNGVAHEFFNAVRGRDIYRLIKDMTDSDHESERDELDGAGQPARDIPHRCCPRSSQRLEKTHCVVAATLIPNKPMSLRNV